MTDRAVRTDIRVKDGDKFDFRFRCPRFKRSDNNRRRSWGQKQSQSLRYGRYFGQDCYELLILPTKLRGLTQINILNCLMKGQAILLRSLAFLNDCERFSPDQRKRILRLNTKRFLVRDIAELPNEQKRSNIFRIDP